MVNLFEFVEQYCQNPRLQPLNHALILFYEALLSRFTAKIEVTREVEDNPSSLMSKIVDHLFKLLMWVTSSDQNVLLMRFMRGISKLVSQTQIECMEFIMTTLHSSISNFKHAYSK